MIGTIEGANVYYNHNDHLSSSNVITNVSGTQKELIDYYPFGGIRLDEKANGFNEKKKFTGHYYDGDTGLNYMVARYYDGNVGRFNSIDPVYSAMGSERLIQAKTGIKQQKLLENPQALNAYSYAINNPLIIYDPSGEWIEYFIGNQNAVSLGNWANNLYNNSTVARYAMDHPFQTGAAAGVLGGAVTAGGVLIGGGSITCGALCGPVAGTITTGGATLGTQSDKIESTIENGTKLLNGPINITANRLQHVLDGHTLGGIESAGNSIFNEGENIAGLIRQGTQQMIEKQAFSNNFQRVFDAGRNIGVDRLTNQQTSIMTVITNKAGDLITSFPGRP